VRFVTVIKVDGQPAIINLDHIVAVYAHEEGTRIALSNGIDIYVKASLTEVLRRIEEVPAA
jgi:uncharacterized protein YlzI (FlbEa/FlbD family)